MSKKTKNPKEKYRYAFPNFLAKAMAKVDMRAQMEAGMMSQFLLLIGLSIMVLYTIFSGQVGGFYKFIVIFNLLCGWVLISSYLVTTYQQYTSYMGAMGFDPKAEKEAVKKNGNIFERIIMAIKHKKKNKKQENGLEEKEEPEDPEEQVSEVELEHESIEQDSNGLVPDFVKGATENLKKNGIVIKHSKKLKGGLNKWKIKKNTM